METQSQGQKLLSWSASTRQEHKRIKGWYIGAAFITLLLLIYSLSTGAWTFTILILMTAGMYLLLHKHKLPQKTIEIQSTGVTYDNIYLSWASFEGFWIFKIGDYEELHIVKAAKQRGGDIVISLKSVDTAQVRSTLTQFIPELANKNEKLFDKITRICKL